VTNEPMTKGKLIELLKDVPDDVLINVLNREGEYTANIDVWFEDLETRQFVTLEGKEPFWKMALKERIDKENSK
jgi:hypothetical protein